MHATVSCFIVKTRESNWSAFKIYGALWSVIWFWVEVESKVPTKWSWKKGTFFFVKAQTPYNNNKNLWLCKPLKHINRVWNKPFGYVRTEQHDKRQAHAPFAPFYFLHFSLTKKKSNSKWPTSNSSLFVQWMYNFHLMIAFFFHMHPITLCA